MFVFDIEWTLCFTVVEKGYLLYLVIFIFFFFRVNGIIVLKYLLWL